MAEPPSCRPPAEAAAANPCAPAPRTVTAVAATLIATGLGSGYAPVAPGTAGTAVGLLFYWPLSHAPLLWQAAALALVSVVGSLAATHVARSVGLKDPGIVVVDEVAGIWLTLLTLPLTPLTAALGFFLFRAMDVLKPWPARQLEALPEGFGIMADDLMAGVYANLLLRVALLVLP